MPSFLSRIIRTDKKVEPVESSMALLVFIFICISGVSASGGGREECVGRWRGGMAVKGSILYLFIYLYFSPLIFGRRLKTRSL